MAICHRITGGGYGHCMKDTESVAIKPQTDHWYRLYTWTAKCYHWLASINLPPAGYDRQDLESAHNSMHASSCNLYIPVSSENRHLYNLDAYTIWYHRPYITLMHILFVQIMWHSKFMEIISLFPYYFEHLAMWYNHKMVQYKMWQHGVVHTRGSGYVI